MSLLHTSILADPTKKVGDTVNGFRITKLDRITGVCELERYVAPVDLSAYAKKLEIPALENKNLYSGSGAPTADVGAEGDFYENLDAKVGEFSIYGPKASGAWPAAAYRKIDDLSVLATKTALTAEETARKSADDALDAKITAEKTARESADTALDLRMVTAENLLNKRQAIRLNRSPTNLDVYEDGTIWEDISFGDTTPLRFVSIAAGVWAYQSQISLTKIRIYGGGIHSTYRSNINGLAFFKDDGTQIPNSWFVWGAKSGFWGAGTPGVAFASQTIEAGYNTYGWADIEVSGQFDPSILIGKITGNTPYFSMGKVEFWYSNGSKKTFSGSGGPTLCTCEPPVVCRYGDALAAAQGEMLTAAKLSDPDDNDYGRTSGAANVGAFNRLLAPTLTLLNALKQVKAGFQTTTLVDGSALPVTTDFPAPSASGFTNDGSGAVAGATSWTNNAPIGVNIGQSGLPEDEYEISVAFGAANPNARISFQVDGVWQNYTAAGVEAGTLDLVEFFASDWRGATLKVKGSFTGMVAFNTTGTTYIGPVIKRKRAKGYEVDGNALALLSDIPAPSIDKRISSGNALPVSSEETLLFVLKGHATLPDGAYYWDGLWVQV